MWWPETRTWLIRTRWTLDKYGVTGGTTLWFTPMHKNVRITLPDLQTFDAPLNFSANVFNNVIALCKKFSELKTLDWFWHKQSSSFRVSVNCIIYLVLVFIL